jgi:chromosome segregation ATPase
MIDRLTKQHAEDAARIAELEGQVAEMRGLATKAEDDAIRLEEQLSEAKSVVAGVRHHNESYRTDNATLSRLLTETRQQLATSEAQAGAMREALVFCQQLFLQISSDWSNPRERILLGLEAISKARATTAGQSLLDELARLRLALEDIRDCKTPKSLSVLEIGAWMRGVAREALGRKGESDAKG